MKQIIPGILFTCLIMITGCSKQPETDSESGKPETDAGMEAATSTENPAEEKTREPVIDEEGYTLLSLDDFEAFEGKPDKGAEKTEAPTWSSSENMILCTGQPRGYLYSKKNFSNFTFEIEVRYPETEKEPEELENSNTGILVYITGEHKLWPVCLEVQGKQKEMCHIKANGRGDVIDAEKVKDNQEARTSSIKKVGEWNHIKIISKDGKLTSFLNGTQICENEPGELKEGMIGIQSERNPIEFRNIRILEE